MCVHVLFGRHLCVCTLRLFSDKGNDNRSESLKVTMSSKDRKG